MFCQYGNNVEIEDAYVHGSYILKLLAVLQRLLTLVMTRTKGGAIEQ